MPSSDRPRAFALPSRIARLEELAYNLWWSWQPHAWRLFRSLDPQQWDALESNPIVMLRRLPAARLEEAAADPAYLAAYDRVMADFDAMLHAPPDALWVGRHAPALTTTTAAYFSAEFGLHPALPIYSGGLGVLAGDHAKASSDLGLPLVGVSLLYRHGYLRQRLNADGWQLDVIAPLEPWEEPTTQVMRADG
ncbi:MAG TPA: DUF3417 domain-containing protein, partial [Thermomicrobiales bacterium]|nr:DUF3417 domain-containing protein [Thermomicrobiales bacterium]